MTTTQARTHADDLLDFHGFAGRTRPDGKLVMLSTEGRDWYVVGLYADEDHHANGDPEAMVDFTDGHEAAAAFADDAWTA